MACVTNQVSCHLVFSRWLRGQCFSLEHSRLPEGHKLGAAIGRTFRACTPQLLGDLALRFSVQVLRTSKVSGICMSQASSRPDLYSSMYGTPMQTQLWWMMNGGRVIIHPGICDSVFCSSLPSGATLGGCGGSLRRGLPIALWIASIGMNLVSPLTDARCSLASVSMSFCVRDPNLLPMPASRPGK